MDPAIDIPAIGAQPSAAAPAEPAAAAAPGPELALAQPEPAAAPAEPVTPAAAEPEAKPDAKPGEITPHTDTPTLLEEAGKKDAAKTDAAATEAKPGEAKPAEVPVAEAAPVSYDLKLPEGVAADPERMQAFTGKLAEFGITPDHGQALLDLHTAHLQQFADHSAREQHRLFSETRKAWRDEVMSHPVLGGSRHETAMQLVADARDMLVPADKMEEFNTMLRVTGVGDHPLFNLLLHNAGQWLSEPRVPSQSGKPPASNGKAPGKTTLREMYRANAEARRGAQN